MTVEKKQTYDNDKDVTMTQVCMLYKSILIFSSIFRYNHPVFNSFEHQVVT